MNPARRLWFCVLSLVLVLSGCVSAGDQTDNVQRQISKPEPNLHEAARLNTQMGIDYLREGRVDRSRAKLRRAIKQDPDYASAHASLGYLYANTGQPDLARKQYRRALSLNDSDPRAHNLYGAFLCSHGEYKPAMQHFKRAADIESNDAREIAITNAGVCDLKHGNLDAARQQFRQALKANPRYGEALLQMANVNYRAHNYGIARGFLKRYEASSNETVFALQLGYRIARAMGNDDQAKAYQSKLQQLQSQKNS